MARSVGTERGDTPPNDHHPQGSTDDESSPAVTDVVKPEPNDNDDNVLGLLIDGKSDTDEEGASTKREEFVEGADEQDYVVGEVVDSEWEREKKVRRLSCFVSSLLLTLVLG